MKKINILTGILAFTRGYLAGVKVKILEEKHAKAIIKIN